MKAMKKSEALEIVEKLKERALAQKDMPAEEFLASLTDNELFAFIAVKTMMSGGRNWKASIENAEYHMENRVRAISLFAR